MTADPEAIVPSRASLDGSPGHASADGQEPISASSRLAMYRRMVEIRGLEKRAYDLFLQNLVPGTSHLAIGHEAIAAAFAEAMRPDDYSFATYRGHGHALARGASMTGILAELLGRANGILGGRGGSMHITDVDHYMMGSYAIVGTHLAIANGAAWSAQYRQSGQAAICFFGDGATNIGTFHEAVNLASVWNLPTVFVCENNLYMEYTPIGAVTPVDHPAADRAASYGLEPTLVDGNDPDEVFRIARHALERAREGGGPALIEALTYRHGGHSRADPGKYRPQEEVDAWIARDPIPMYRERLAQAGFSGEELTAVEVEVERLVDEATDAAKAGPLPDDGELFANLWADGGAAWRK